jgi:hypothetical protein
MIMIMITTTVLIILLHLNIFQSAGVAQLVLWLGHGLGGPAFEFRQRQETFLQNAQTGSGTHSGSYVMGTEVLSRW